MHENNPHFNGYDMTVLAQALPELKPYILMGKNNRLTINFADDHAVKCLNKALLVHHYQLAGWDIPQGYLCPPIPGRADYLCHLSEYLKRQNVIQDKPIKALDIGTGANLIYPLLANRLLGWKMVASDIDDGALTSAQSNINRNQALSLDIELRKQSSSEHSFTHIIQKGEYYDVTLCNPPFHESQEAAAAGSERKNKNLNRNKQKRQSNVKRIQKTNQLNFAGQGNELWCQGGEKRFIINMIYDSQNFKQQVGCFTCLVSKKETLPAIKKLLNKLNAKFDVVDMHQGNKVSRFIAWRY